jgi:putative polyhydroxyalkanoate system protein
MPKFEVDIPHALTPPDVRGRLERASSKLEKDYGATCHWDGDRCLVVARKGLNARVTLEETRIHVAVDLAFLLSPMATTIRTGITKQLTDLLAAPPAAPPPDPKP